MIEVIERVPGGRSRTGQGRSALVFHGDIIVGVGLAETGPPGVELVEVPTVPVERGADHLVKILQRRGTRDLEASPDRRLGALQGDLELGHRSHDGTSLDVSTRRAWPRMLVGRIARPDPAG